MSRFSGRGESEDDGTDVGRELRPILTEAERLEWLERGVADFRAGRYYECHEAFETVWRSNRAEPRDLWRGLIQIAVGLYHFFERRRPDVALRVLRRGRRRILPFGPTAAGLDLETLARDLDPWEDWLEGGGSQEKVDRADPPPLPRLGWRVGSGPVVSGKEVCEKGVSE